MIILFDGVCNFCNTSVNFIIDRDRKGVFKFTTLQSEVGQELLLKFGLVTSNFDSIVLIDGFRVYQKSDAALEIIRKIDGFWKVLYIFKIIPALLRNLFYDIVAQNRYRICGRTKTCQLPSPALKARFL